jgi:PAS domain S-box-containing protein
LRKRAAPRPGTPRRELEPTVNAIPALVGAFLTDGTLDFVNHAFLSYTGLGAAEKSLVWVEALHPEDVSAHLAAWQASAKTGLPFQTESRFRRFDGEYRWFLVHAVPRRNDAGSITRWCATCTDINDRKLAEIALLSHEAYLAEAQRLSQMGSFVWTISSGEISWSEESSRILGYHSQIRPSIPLFLQRVYPADVTLVQQVINRAVNNRRDFDFEHRLMLPDGTVKFVQVAAHAVKDGGETRFVGALIDRTARRQLEQELRYNEQRHRELLNHVPVALIEIDGAKSNELLNGLRTRGVTDIGAYLNENPDFGRLIEDSYVIRDANQRTVEMFGIYAAHELFGLSITAVLAISPGTSRRAIESRFRGEKSFQEEIKFESFDGRSIDALLTLARQEESGRTFIALVDISDRVRAQERLEQVRAEFAHAARISMLGEFTASIAHEVNQPLGAIRINCETSLRWLDRPQPNVAKARELVELTLSDARRAADIVARIRTMATGRLPQRVSLSLHDVIEESIVFVTDQLQSNGVIVSLDLAQGLPELIGDRTQLQQVIVNLALNAIQAMSQSASAHRSLLIRTKLTDADIVLCTVEDSGPGIDALHLSRLFESFFTTKDAGMGMGLSVSRSIVEAHGGQLRADNDSTLGGARFTIQLPVNDLPN